MYLDPEDKELIIMYLSDHKTEFLELKPIKVLGKIKEELYKKYEPSFYEDIDYQYYTSCRLAIAEDIGRATGLSVDGIMFILESMGLEHFMKYMEIDNVKRKTKRKRTVRGNKNSKSSSTDSTSS